MKVLWPNVWDSLLNSHRIQNLSKTIKDTIDSTFADLNIEFPEFEGEDAVLQFFKYLSSLRQEELPDDKKRTALRSLIELEGVFNEVANLLSIIAVSYRKRHERILLLGDADNDILDSITIPGNNNFCYIKAAHHGTMFGDALKNTSTEFLLISRSKKEFPRTDPVNNGYLLKSRCKLILSTEYLHNCFIS